MHRFKYLTEKINKGYDATFTKSTRSGGSSSTVTAIPDWSPHNVRRLVIGFEYALVQYFVSSPKTPKKLERIDLRSGVTRDVELVQTGGTGYKSIIESITSGRVLSCLEEVIFLTKDYPTPILQLDSNITHLESNNTRLHTRFPRLRHVSLVNTDYQTIHRLMEQSEEGTELLLDALKEQKIPTKTLVEQHQDDWWSGRSLRSDRYTMDGGTLERYFDSIKDKMQEKEETLLKGKLDQERETIILNKHLPELREILTSFLNLFDQGCKLFEDSSFVSKSLWSNLLQDLSQYRAISRSLSKPIRQTKGSTPTTKDDVNEIRRVDFEAIYTALRRGNYETHIEQDIERARTIIFRSLHSEEEYKRQSNKDSLDQSLITLRKIGLRLLRLEINLVYTSFVKYLLRNSVDNVNYFYGFVEREVGIVTYTRSTIEFMNTIIEHGIPKKVMDTIGAKEVLEEQFRLGSRYAEALKLMKALSSQAKA